MMDLFSRLWSYRYFGHVNRFHCERMIGEKPTVYHHSASVGIILIAILGDKLSVNLLKAALLHDLEERITGDIPAPVKWEAKGLIGALEERVRDHFQIPEPGLTDEEVKYLKAADFLDAVLNCLEQRLLGNRFIDDCFDNYERYAEKCDFMLVHQDVYSIWGKVRSAYHIEKARTMNPMMKVGSGGDFWK